MMLSEIIKELQYIEKDYRKMSTQSLRNMLESLIEELQRIVNTLIL